MTTGNNVNALVSAMIDGEQLDRQESDQITAAMATDARVSRDAALQSATRALVRSRSTALRAEVPQALRSAVLLSLDQMDEQSKQRATSDTGWSFGDAVRSLFATPRFVRGLVAIGSVAAIALVTLLVLRTPGSPSGTITDVAYSAFGDVSSGAFTIERTSSDPAELTRFFADNGVAFNVFFPQIDASLRGGSVVKINGKACAQLVYSAGSKPVYLLETDNSDIARGDVALDREIQDDVEQSRWHWQEHADRGTMFVWKSNNVMCTAVSDLPVSDFSALFRLETL